MTSTTTIPDTPERPLRVINTLDQEIGTDTKIDEITEVFQNQHVNTLEPTSSRNYYPRPTFPDLQIEERGQFSQAAYHGGTIIKIEEGADIEDAVATLIFSIAKQFLSDLSIVRDKTSEILANLRCRKLQDFRWYKDVFLSKVLTRTDCNQAFWKEKFIAGLPNLFAEIIRKQFRSKHNGHIPYDSLTYGDIISTITAEGIALCTYFKLQQQIKHENATSRKELGTFCQQFGFENLTPPSK
ncbi:uncharacterized protein LOC132309243 [Cornus florida]|uniref:uncharacterized protein LOC132309243 n=1 Tax=Cornus florida TaxID=4283 RepID=UPI002896CB57|nr:uncharacterized protein LOC132309243 [Cornus florida]